jgi:hypothetical protein
MGILDDPLDPHALEQLQRSVVMLTPGQSAGIERNRALVLLGELRRLQDQQRAVARDLKVLLDQLQGVDRHPARAD